MFGRETISSLRAAATRVNEAGYDAQLAVRELSELKPDAQEAIAAWKTAGQIASIAIAAVAIALVIGITVRTVGEL